MLYPIPKKFGSEVEPQVGMKVRIVEMKGEPQYTGKEGVIKYIDSIGQLHGTWGGCAIIPEEDIFIVLED